MSSESLFASLAAFRQRLCAAARHCPQSISGAMLFQAACAACSPTLRDCLARCGMLRPAALANAFTDEEVSAGSVFHFLETQNPGVGADGIMDLHTEFLDMVMVAKETARRDRGAAAATHTAELSMRAEKSRRTEAHAQRESAFRAAAAASARATPPPPAQPRYLGPSVARPSTQYDGDAEGRARAEGDARARAVSDLIELMQEAGGGDRGRLHLAAAGRRVRTLRKRVNAWRALRRWLLAARGRPHTSDVDDLLDYMEARAAEPCGRTVLDSLLALFGFVDAVMGRRGDARWMADARLTSAAKELQVQLALRQGGPPRGPALRPPARLLAALESHIVDLSGDAYDRAMSWWFALSAWGVLRFDDHRGLHPASPHLHDNILSFRLTRTKTTGADKGLQERFVSVSVKAYLTEPRWLEMGLELWAEHAGLERDYFLLARGIEGGVIHREVSYEEYVGTMRRVLAGLRVCDDEGNTECLGTDFAMCYTAHSWRSFLPSGAARMGAPQQVLDALGTWRPKGGAVYARTLAARTTLIQERVAEELRRVKLAVDIISEHADIDLLKEKLNARGASGAAVTRIVGTMTLGSEGKVANPCWGALADAAATQAEVSATSSSSTSPPAPSGAKHASATRRMPADVVGYVVSIVRRGRSDHRKLHYLGLCHLVPGVDYLHFEELGTTMPFADAYDSVCSRCWPEGKVTEDKVGISSEVSEGESSVAPADDRSD